MAAYQYKIGTTQVGMTLLSTLGIPAPRHGFVKYSVYTVLGDGSTQGNGWSTDEWYWGFITSAQRATLRSLIPNAGAHIFIRNLLTDGTTWKDFDVQVEWPQNEDRQAGKFLGFSLKFKAMIELADL